MVGFALLGRGPADGFLSLTLAPLFLLFGYFVAMPFAILFRPRTDPGDDTVKQESVRRLGAKPFVAAAVAVISFIVYLRTVAPTATFWDSGELITAAHSLGIPHPPGAPVYILLGRVFSILPLGDDIGFRLNLLSAICSAATTAFTFLIVLQLARLLRGRPKEEGATLSAYAGAAVGSLAFAFAFSQWANSVEAELYAPAVLLISLILWVALRWTLSAGRPGSERQLLLVAYLFGVGMALHLIVVLALPAILLLVYVKVREAPQSPNLAFAAGGLLFIGAVYPGVAQWLPSLMAEFSPVVFFLVLAALAALAVFARKGGRRWLALGLLSLFLVTMGYSIYATFYVRSQLDPILDENNPDTPDRFAKYIKREQYGSWSLTERRAPLWDYQIKMMYIRYLGWQFIGKEPPRQSSRQDKTLSLDGLWGLPFLLGLFGAVRQFRRDRRRAAVVLLLFFMTGLAIVLYVNQVSPQPRERDYSYTGSFFAFCLWIGLGASALLDLLRMKLKKGGTLGRMATAFGAVLLLAAVPGKMLAHNLSVSDRSTSYQAVDFAYNLLQTCELNALLFTRGDNDTYPAWFLQYVNGIRKDVTVVNLSLLNTPWYVRQLRDAPSGVPVAFPESQIDQLCRPRELPDQRVTIPLPEGARREWRTKLRAADSTYAAPGRSSMDLDLKASSLGRRVRPQDLVMTHIVSENRFRRPVYFSVTTHPYEISYLDGYLRLEGLALRLIPAPTMDLVLDVESIRKNLYEVYRYRGQEGVVLLQDLGSKSIFERYVRAFVALAEHFRGLGLRAEVRQVLEKMDEVMDPEKIPAADGVVELILGRLWEFAGKKGGMGNRLQRVLRVYDLAKDDRFITLASFLEGPGELLVAESAARGVLRDEPGSAGARGFLITVHILQGRRDEAMRELNLWMQSDPRSEVPKRIMSRLTRPTGSLGRSAGASLARAF